MEQNMDQQNMDQQTSGLLHRLKDAILASLHSQNIEESIIALEQSGYRVFVSLDAVLAGAATLPEPEAALSLAAEPCSLSPSDEVFLQSLHIAF